MEQWEKNLRDEMSSNGFHSLKKKNDRLFEWIKQWKNTVEEADGFRVSISSDYHGGERTIIVQVHYQWPWNPFIAQLGYTVDETGRLLLSNRFAVAYDASVELRNTLFKEKSDPYCYTEDYISGLEMLEKGYVLETLNLAFLNYFTKKNWPDNSLALQDEE
jgi:hypothetical protein